jgi:hypothetical protein
LQIIDYDKIEEWEPWLSKILCPSNSGDIKQVLLDEKPQCTEEARDIVSATIGIEEVTKRLEGGLKGYGIRLYHGTRVSDIELEDIKSHGLKPLALRERKESIAGRFSSHPDWAKTKSRWDEVFEKIVSEAKEETREGALYACFSRTELISGSCHYVKYGAELDKWIARCLFNKSDADELLRKGRSPYLVSFIKPYEEAERAANPNGFDPRVLSNLSSALLEAWAYRQFDESFRPEYGCITSAMFREGINKNELDQFELLSDEELD